MDKKNKTNQAQLTTYFGKLKKKRILGIISTVVNLNIIRNILIMERFPRIFTAFFLNMKRLMLRQRDLI